MRLNLTKALLFSMISAAATGCATPARIPREQAAEIDARSGLVFGSIRIRVDPSLPDRSFSFSPGRESAGASHALVIDCTTRLQALFGFRNVTVLALTLGDELIVVQELPARTCELIDRAEGGSGFVVGAVSSSIGKVGVSSGRAIYFGAIDFALPTVLATGSIGRSTVLDHRARTLEALRPEYGPLLDEAPYQAAQASAGACCAAEEYGSPGSEPTPRPEPLTWLAGEWELTGFLIGGESEPSRAHFGTVSVASPSEGSVSISASTKDHGDYSLRLTQALGTNNYLIDVQSKYGISVDSFPVTYVEGEGWHGTRDQLLEGRMQSVTVRVSAAEEENWYGWVIEVLPTAAAQLSYGDVVKSLEEPYLKADLTRRK